MAYPDNPSRIAESIGPNPAKMDQLDILDYAIQLGKRWRPGEPYLLNNPGCAWAYAAGVIHGRWPEAEPTIMGDPDYAYEYALDIVKNRPKAGYPTTVWPEGESYILTDPGLAFYYAKNILKGRWPEAEPIIMKSPEWAYDYASAVIYGRWPEYEEYMAKEELSDNMNPLDDYEDTTGNNKNWWRIYQREFLNV